MAHKIKKKFEPMKIEKDGQVVKTLNGRSEALRYMERTVVGSLHEAQAAWEKADKDMNNQAIKTATKEREYWSRLQTRIVNHFQISMVEMRLILDRVLGPASINNADDAKSYLMKLIEHHLRTWTNHGKEIDTIKKNWKISDAEYNKLLKDAEARAPGTALKLDDVTLKNPEDGLNYLKGTLIPNIVRVKNEIKEAQKKVDKGDEKQKEVLAKLKKEQTELDKKLNLITEHFSLKGQAKALEQQMMSKNNNNNNKKISKKKARFGDFGGYLSNDYLYDDEYMDRMSASQSYLYPDINFSPYYGHYDKPSQVFGTNEVGSDLSSTYIGLLLLTNIVFIVIIICLCACLIICGLNRFNQRRYSSARDWKEEDERV